MIKAKIVDTPYLVYKGKKSCQYLESDMFKALNLVAQSIYHDFPRHDRRLWVGDGSPFSGCCDGHPGISHGKGVTVDVNYYTLADTNHTQYPGYGTVDLWEKPGEVLHEHVFDWERNFYFFYRLHQICGAVSSVNDVLCQVIETEVKKRRGMTLFFDAKIQQDEGRAYNHHTHAHIDFGAVDLSFNVNEFLTPRG